MSYDESKNKQLQLQQIGTQKSFLLFFKAETLDKSASGFRIILAGKELHDNVRVTDCDLGPQTVIHAIRVVYQNVSKGISKVSDQNVSKSSNETCLIGTQQSLKTGCTSSLRWIIIDSFCSFSYNGVDDVQFISVLENVAQNQCAPWYGPSVGLKRTKRIYSVV